MSSRRERRRQGHTAADFSLDESLRAADQVHYGGPIHDELLAAARKRPKVRPVSLNDMVVDEAIQVRVGGVGGLDLKHVESLVQVLINGGAFQDDIVLFYEHEDLVNGQLEPAPPFTLADGFHRRQAYIDALAQGRMLLDSGALPPDVNLSAFEAPRCSLRFGTFEDAYQYAEEANLKHGQMLSNKDKRNILLRRMERGHAWLNASANSIAADLGVTDKTVSRWKAEIVTELGLTSDNSEVVSADGRVMRTEKIGPRSTQTASQKSAHQACKSLRSAIAHLSKIYDDPQLVTYLADLVKAIETDFLSD